MIPQNTVTGESEREMRRVRAMAEALEIPVPRDHTQRFARHRDRHPVEERSV